MRWYYDTMRCPTMPCGFQNSVFVDCCGREGCVCPNCIDGEFTAVPTEPPVPPTGEEPELAEPK